MNARERQVLEPVAYHEAGHAVVMRVRRVPLGLVSIDGHGTSAQGASTTDYRALVAVSLAGCIAEDRFLGQPDPTHRVITRATPIVYYFTGDAAVRASLRPERELDDFRLAGSHAVRAADAARPGLPKIEARTVALNILNEEATAVLCVIDTCAEAVRAIAEALLDCSTIPPDVAEEIIDSHQVPRPA